MNTQAINRNATRYFRVRFVERRLQDMLNYLPSYSRFDMTFIRRLNRNGRRMSAVQATFNVIGGLQGYDPGIEHRYAK